MKVRYQTLPTSAATKQLPDDKIDYSMQDQQQVIDEDIETKYLKSHESERKQINDVSDDFLLKIVQFIERRIKCDNLNKESIASLKGKEKVNGLYSCRTLPLMTIHSYLLRLNKYSAKKLRKIISLCLSILIDI